MTASIEGENRPLLGEESNEMDKSATYTSLIGSNLFSGIRTWIAQLGLLLAVATTLTIVAAHPSGLFTYHPAFQILAVLFFAEGILLLQPIGNSKRLKVLGLDIHQASQTLGLLLGIVGVSIIWYNKKLHGASHFTTWHGKFGLITIVFAIIQGFLGFAIGRNPGQRWIGESRAKALWKWHRASGYINITLLFITPALALEYADWTRMNSSRGERTVAGLGLLLAWLALITRFNSKKMRLVGSSSKHAS